MKKSYFLISACMVVSGIVFIAFAGTSNAASQRVYADPDGDGYGTPNDYIMIDDKLSAPDGYILWIVGHDNDNCPNVYNPDQADTNENGVGDACDSNQNTTIEPLDIDLNKIAIVSSQVPRDFYISGVEYPQADYDSSNFQVKQANDVMLEVLHSYYQATDNSSYSIMLRSYDSILDAKAIFDKHNTQHVRTVLNLGASEQFGDDVFCHNSPDFTTRNAGLYYYICGMRYNNIYVHVQGTITKPDYTTALQLLRSVHTNLMNYNPNRPNPVIESSAPPIIITEKPDLVIDKISVSPTTNRLTVQVTNNSSVQNTRSFELLIKRANGSSWTVYQSFSTTNPLHGKSSVSIPAGSFSDGVYSIEAIVDHNNVVAESNELNNSKTISFTLSGLDDSPEAQELRERIVDLSYTSSRAERDVLETEMDLVKQVDSELTNRLKGWILLQVEDDGHAWYVDSVTGQKFYLKDGATAYQALKAFGLGVTNADLEKIPIGFENRFSDFDGDADGLADKLEEALGTDPKNPDSDGDGYQDGEEVRGNYDPLGSGRMSTDTSFANRLKGKILLQVEGQGEAWYVNPADGKRYYMKDGEAAYQIMRFLSLGITNSDLRKISVGLLE